MSDVFYSEILRQPDAIERAADALRPQRAAFAELTRIWRDGPLRHIILTGMGGSFDACIAAASELGSHGVHATPVNTAELVHFRVPMLAADTLIVAVSQSGRSIELVRLTTALAELADPPPLITVTNGTNSLLASAATVAFDTVAGVERGPSTMTFAATFPALATIADILAGVPAASAVDTVVAEAKRAAASARELLVQPKELAVRMAGWLGGREKAVLVGRGTARAAAELGALVLKEAAHLPAECLDTAEFRHGPLELAGPDLAVAIVATEASTYPLDIALAAELATHGAAVAFLSADGMAPSGAIGVRVGPAARLLAPAVAAIPFHLLAWYLAVADGREPGRFQVAHKITTTE